ncbi:MAG: nitrite reductase small subunit NirD [Rhodospirillales bacterium]
MAQWIDVGAFDDIPRQGARTVQTSLGDVAVFRTLDDEVFALVDRCPHRGGPLSQGIVHGRKVACPLHNWNIDLTSGEATGADEGCTPAIPVQLDEGRVRLYLDAEATGTHG